MKPDNCAVIIFTRAPVPGRVNRRLIPALGEAVAAELYLELLRNTVATAVASACGTVQLHCTPDTGHTELQSLAREFNVTLLAQKGGDLGERMANALHAALADHRAAVLLGCDIPELAGTDIDTACRRLNADHDVVIGPAEDGGYYLLGLSRPCPELFRDQAWGRGGVLAETRRRIDELGLHCFELPLRWDVDRPQDVIRYRERCGTRINLAGKY